MNQDYKNSFYIEKCRREKFAQKRKVDLRSFVTNETIEKICKSTFRVTTSSELTYVLRKNVDMCKLCTYFYLSNGKTQGLTFLLCRKWGRLLVSGDTFSSDSESGHF